MSSYYDGLNEKLLGAIPPAEKILELGCANGNLGCKYKSLNPESQWIGVDSNEQALSVARTRLDQVYMFDLDADDLSVVGSGFDVIVIGDLLEHLREPESLLRDVRMLCKPSARLVCCVPNMSHVSVLERFVAGDVTYDDMGLLDKTHLRFFSPSSIFKLFLDSGWLPNLSDYYAGVPENRKFADMIVAAGESLGIPQETTKRNISLYQLIIDCIAMPDSAKPVASHELSIVVPVNNDQQLNLNIQKSPGLKEINAEIIVCRGASSAAEAFDYGVSRASSKWMVFCHQDVYFPRGSGVALCDYLETIPAGEAPGLIIGFAGVGVNASSRSFKSGLVIDRLNRFDCPSADIAISIDELAVVFNKDTEHVIDPDLGWHLWATDLCLKSVSPANQLFARIVRIPLFHNSYNDGRLSDSFHKSARLLAAKYPGYPVIPTLCGNIRETG